MSLPGDKLPRDRGTDDSAVGMAEGSKTVRACCLFVWRVLLTLIMVPAPIVGFPTALHRAITFQRVWIAIY